ncbi:hypothetical protein BJX70DRAFT_373863 [Aspergillus crustosus]
MKVKQRSTCQQCRTRKLGCDGKTPECSQCTFSGYTCDGYSSEWTFVNETRPQSRKRVKRPRAQQEQGNETQPPPIPAEATPGSSDFIALIIRNYMPESEREYIFENSDTTRSRICGSWVETLPELLNETPNTSVLYSAANALAMAISSPSAQPTGSVACTQAYSTAIKALQKGFMARDTLCPAQLTASVMCLGLVEVMFPDSSLGVAAHFSGIEQLFRVNGPEKYSSGVLHKLFVGFRPLLIVQALQNRQKTFLAEDDWMTTPFAIFSPSPMQNLLNEGLPLTSVLHEINHLLASTHQSTLEAAALATVVLDIRASLKEWEISLRDSLDGASYWQNSSSTHKKSASSQTITMEPNLWFPNITLANVYTHLWAFNIICLSEITDLCTHFPTLLQEHRHLRERIAAENPDHETLRLAEQICASMEYLLQDEMGLFGPGSTFLPLMMAHRVLLNDPEDTRCEKLDWVRGIVERLVEKGLRSAPAVVFQQR